MNDMTNLKNVHYKFQSNYGWNCCDALKTELNYFGKRWHLCGDAEQPNQNFVS